MSKKKKGGGGRYTPPARRWPSWLPKRYLYGYPNGDLTWLRYNMAKQLLLDFPELGDDASLVADAAKADPDFT